MQNSVQNELVSIVTPFYNSEKYLSRLLDSVLGQTYPDIEMIAVDDGSTDTSADIVSSYVPKFESRGYSLTLVRQKNKGQSAAIYGVLPKVRGKYLIWPDSDDYYASENAIARMVSTLREAGDAYGSVRTQRSRYSEQSGELIEVQGLDFVDYDDNSLFYDALKCKNGWFFGVGAFMIDFEKFKQITRLRMYHRKGTGQNWQLMLPILYHYRCCSIREPLFNVIDHNDSHSHLIGGNNRRELQRHRQFMVKLVYTVMITRGMPLRNKIDCSVYSVKKYGKKWLRQLKSIVRSRI